MLELVAQAARRAGHEVKLIDLQVETHAAYRRLIANWRPDFIAFSCNYLANVPEIIHLAKETKAALPRTFICVGGIARRSPPAPSSITARTRSIACSRAKARLVSSR